MKKFLTLLCGGLIALSLFVATGNTVKAAGTTNAVEEPCGCQGWTPLTGAERNKIVADFISSEAFKGKKMELNKEGYKWNGAHAIEVIKPFEGLTMVGVPFTSNEGAVEIFVFINGVFVDSPFE